MPSGSLRRSDPYVYAIAAVVCAAALVLYFQHGSLVERREQTAVVLHEIAEQTALAVVAEVRSTLEGPVFDTLTAVNHPQIRDSRLDLLSAEYRSGLVDYPQVERFFVWTEQTNRSVPNEVLFLGRGHSTTADAPADIPPEFDRDPALGREIFQMARRYAPSQQIYVAFSDAGSHAVHDVLVRLFWTDARRDHFFAVTGFVVDRPQIRDALFPELHRRRLQQLLKVRGDDLPFELRVRDERGHVVWGPSTEQPLAARVELPMLFYPAQSLGPRLARGIEPVTWTVEVSPAHANELLASTGQAYWLPLLSIVLMLVALSMTIHAGRRAARVAEMQAEFVAHVSHELKTPLSLISAATETVQLARVQSPEKLSQYLGIIRGEVNRLSSLVQRVLEFSSVERRLEFDHVDLASLARETVDAFRTSLEGRNFTFRFIQDGPAPQLEADPAALEQALANLLDNAVKYSGDVREVTVRVGWAGAHAVIDVIDQGIGIAPEDRSHIFDKFYRGSGDAHRRRGFGLGLAITKELVAAHNGHVDLHASGPHGSTFRISLPAAPRHAHVTMPSRLELTS